MPTYVFLCHECGLESEAHRRVANMNDPFPCPSCNTLATRCVTTPNVIVGGSPDFSKREKRDLDVVIGKQSEQRWAAINQESSKKAQVRDQTGQHALGKRADGTYVPLSDGHLRVREKALTKFEYAKKHGTKVERND